jgi:MFS family permease
MSGVHLGGFLVPVLALGIDSHGFRWATLGIGVFLLATVGPAAKIVRDRPEDYGMHPDGGPTSPQATGGGGGAPSASDEGDLDFTAAQALRTPVFYILTIAHLSSSVSIVTLALHLVPKLTDIGFSLGGAGVVVLTYTAIALPVQFVAGYVADRLPKPPVIFVFLLLQAIGILVIALAENAPMAFLFAVLYGIGFGGRIPLLTAIRGEYFGRKAFATIMGLSQFPNNIVMIGAPLFAGYMFDTTGSYAVPFTTFAVANLLGAFLMLFVKRPSTLRFASPPRS